MNNTITETPVQKIWRLLKHLERNLAQFSPIPGGPSVGHADLQSDLAEIRDALREIENHGGDQDYADHVNCKICGNCVTCNLRPCRDGGPHNPDMRPCVICGETADKHEGPNLLCFKAPAYSGRFLPKG